MYYSVKSSSQQAQQEIACSVKASNLAVVILFRVKDCSISNSRGSVVVCMFNQQQQQTDNTVLLSQLGITGSIGGGLSGELFN